MSKRVGRVTYERRYVIIQVPDDWTIQDPLPATSPDDQWFDSVREFVAALDAPYDHSPINRRPWNALPPGAVPLPEKPR